MPNEDERPVGGGEGDADINAQHIPDRPNARRRERYRNADSGDS